MTDARPASSAEWIALGEHHLAEGRAAEAAACYERAVQLEPDSWKAWARLGKLHMATRQFDAAEAALSRASSLRPDVAELHTLQAYAFWEQNHVEAAIAACRQALAIDPRSVHAAIAEALMIPPIYADSGELRVWRDRYASGLDRLEATMPTWLENPRRILDLEWSNFLLAYQGEDDLELQERYSAFVAALLDRAVPELQSSIVRDRSSDGRVRVGFVSADFRRATVGDYFLRWITDLPRDRFHVTTFYTGHLVDDRTATIVDASDSFVQLSGASDHVARAVRATPLDIVVLPDVGMSAKSVLLANLRLAPVQCAAWGHPVTTGSAFVDYFVSCDPMEPDDARSHYSEALLRLPGIGVRYRAPDCTDASARAHFGLPEDKRIYVCPQSLCKIHPDNDALFIDIVERDESALVVLFAGQANGQTQAIARRLEQGLRRRGVPPRKQFMFLPRMGRQAFLRVMQLSEVMIDTRHWSGGNTTLDALSVALPIVTLEGRFMRGRQTAAMLRILGVEELIASNPEQYVALAARIAGDREYRDALSASIRAALPKLFDRSEPIAAFAETLERIAGERLRK